MSVNDQWLSVDYSLQDKQEWFTDVRREPSEELSQAEESPPMSPEYTITVEQSPFSPPHSLSITYSSDSGM